jgi:prolyl 4-hydroxylase
MLDNPRRNPAQDEKVDRAVALLGAPAGGRDVQAALGLLHEVAADGSGRAAHQLAVIAAIGVLEPPGWPQALSWLARSAELGFALAQSQLRLLSSRDDADWPALAKAIDLDAWLSRPAKVNVCESPRVRSIAGFVPPAVCDWLMHSARDRLAPARTYSDTGEARLESGRTNSEADFNLADLDVVLLLVRARIAAAVGMPTSVMEPAKLLHYQPGQRFSRHFDWLDPEIAGHATEIAARGQRIATFLVYLNDGYEGGETEFAHPRLRHKGAKGDGVFFANVDLAGDPDRQCLHQGLPPIRGEKWLLSQWIRNRPQ